jgi:hypothetical protein
MVKMLERCKSGARASYAKMSPSLFFSSFFFFQNEVFGRLKMEQLLASCSANSTLIYINGTVIVYLFAK